MNNLADFFRSNTDIFGHNETDDIVITCDNAKIHKPCRRILKPSNANKCQSKQELSSHKDRWGSGLKQSKKNASTPLRCAPEKNNMHRCSSLIDVSFRRLPADSSLFHTDSTKDAAKHSMQNCIQTNLDYTITRTNSVMQKQPNNSETINSLPSRSRTKESLSSIPKLDTTKILESLLSTDQTGKKIIDRLSKNDRISRGIDMQPSIPLKSSSGRAA